MTTQEATKLIDQLCQQYGEEYRNDLSLLYCWANNKEILITYIKNRYYANISPLS